MEKDSMKELSMEQMEAITGGVGRTVNTGYSDMEAALRAGPSKSSKQIGHVPNGTVVDTVSDVLVYDEESGRHFVQVRVNGKVGWIASSIVGMKR